MYSENSFNTKTLSKVQVKEKSPIAWPLISESISLSVKSSGLILWFCIFVLALLEVKFYYNIDVIPNYNSSVDDTYGIIKGTVSEFLEF